MFNFSSRIENLLANLKGLDKKEYWINNTFNYLFEDFKEEKQSKKDIFELNKINRRYYVKKRINQILDSLDNNVKREIRVFERNLKIVKSNIKIINEDLQFLDKLIKEIDEESLKKEVETLKLLFNKLEKLLKVKNIALMNFYLKFSEELINRKKQILSFKRFLKREMSSDELLLLLKELYLNFKLLEDFYVSFKIELSQKMEKINNELYLLDKKIEEKIEVLIKKRKLIQLKNLNIDKEKQIKNY